MYHISTLKLVKFWRHKKTGGIYCVHSLATVSTNGVDNGKQVIAYCNSEWEMFSRDVDEFLDGRFEPMPSDVLKTLQ